MIARSPTETKDLKEKEIKKASKPAVFPVVFISSFSFLFVIIIPTYICFSSLEIERKAKQPKKKKKRDTYLKERIKNYSFGSGRCMTL